MSKHPCPKHVVEAVAKALMKSSETRDAFGAGGDWDAAGHTIKQEFLGHAETALQTLWDASQVDTVEQSEQMSDDMSLASEIRRLHQPSLHRVHARVPGIIQDAPACQECSKAHPCPTYQLTEQTMTTNTSIDTQQLTVDVLRSAAEQLEDKRLALGMMGRTQAFLEGVQVGIQYLHLEAEHIEQENNDTEN